MGNYRFKLSDMIPNSWIYKLRDMGKGKNNPTNTCHNHNKKQTLLVSASATQSSKSKRSLHFQPRKSYYFTRELVPTDGFHNSPPRPPQNHHFPHLQPQPPRKSSQQRRGRRRATINRTSSPRRPITSSVSEGCNCRTTLESVWTKSDISPPQQLLLPSSTSPTNFASSPEFRTDHVLTTDHQESFDAMVSWSRDIVIDVDQKSLETKPKLDADHAHHDHNSLFNLQLAPIITKPHKFSDMLNDIKKLNEPKEVCWKKEKETETVTKKASDVSVVKIRKEAEAETAVAGKQERSLTPGVRKSGVNSQVGGVRLRSHSPRVGSRKAINQGRVNNINSNADNSNKMGRRRRSSGNSSSGSASTASSKESRKKLSKSFAVMKSSYDPQRDFRESMVEMIVENNIRASKDLEDLLACYLCLNADEYHQLIIKVFKQIWFDLTDIRTN